MKSLDVGVLTTLALVLGAAAMAKLRRPSTGGISIGRFVTREARPLAVAELAVAASVLLAPGRVAGFILAGFFAAFAVAHASTWRAGQDEDCGCFAGELPASSVLRRLGLTAGSALLALAAAALGPPSLAALAFRAPGSAAGICAGAIVAAWLWYRAFMGREEPGWVVAPERRKRGPVTERLVVSSAAFLERRVSRRTALVRLATAGSALTVAPLRYLLYPGTALAQIGPGSCSSGACTDGYTIFCCQINKGQNTCPSGTFPGGWWMCTDYTGRQLCYQQGVRYYVDCNQLPGSSTQYACQCANNSCNNMREACNIFRYGQCNTQIGGTTAVVCRMIVCENPGSISGLNCSSSVAVDDNVCAQDASCLEPQAVQLPGAGGV